MSRFVDLEFVVGEEFSWKSGKAVEESRGGNVKKVLTSKTKKSIFSLFLAI